MNFSDIIFKQGFREKGFSMLEVLISMIIFGIVLAGAAPAFIAYLKLNTLSELRSGAAVAGQLKLDELRFEDPTSLPNSGSVGPETITVGDRTYDVTTSYCDEASYCITNNNRHITIDVEYNGTNQYSIQTVFTKLR